MSEFIIFLEMGFSHITDPNGYDHILFVAAICALFSKNEVKKLLLMITAFTFGHSVSLILAILDYFPIHSEWIEFLIPITILMTCFANIKQGEIKEGKSNITLRYWVVLGFGLIHGLGFANYLKSLIGKEESLVMPLLSFNLGLEIGQILVVAMILLLSEVFFFLGFSKKEWNFVLSAFVAGVAVTVLQKTWIF